MLSLLHPLLRWSEDGHAQLVPAQIFFTFRFLHAWWPRGTFFILEHVNQFRVITEETKSGYEILREEALLTP
jgi:hypothetical protein